MNQHILDSGSRDGVFGGTFLSLLAALHAADLAQAALLAATGTAVSFTISLMLPVSDAKDKAIGKPVATAQKASRPIAGMGSRH